MKALTRVLALASLTIVLIVFVWENRGRTAPGTLHRTHAAEPRLVGPAGCPACHGGGDVPDLATACAQCHTAVATQIAQRHGLHGSLQAPVAARCGKCHVEHLGSRPLVDARAFAAAGVADATRYDHRHVAGFALTGAHQDLACDKCHADAAAAVLSKGQTRFLGLQQTCTACHDDVHRGGFGADCAACHGQQQAFARAPAFAHTAAFPLTAGHADRACKECHAADSPHAVATLMHATPAAARTCQDCHATPHAVGGKAVQLAGSERCDACHDTRHFTPAQFGANDHARVAFALDGAHAKTNCATCHGGGDKPQRWAAGTQPRGDDCNACHASPHAGGGTAVRLADSERCATCHDTQHFAPARFTANDHARVAFALVGAHAKTDCAACHGDGAKAQRWAADSHPRMADCAACHPQPHRPEFFATEAQAASIACITCHAADAASFASPQAKISPDQHLATGFALVVPHDKAACAGCHQPGLPFAQRYPGRAADDCRACHVDPHEGQLEARRACLDCHARTHFAPSTFGVEAHAQAAFALTGAHQAIACVRCHAPAKARTAGKTDPIKATTGKPQPGKPQPGKPSLRLRPLPTTCQSCHADVHGGAFDRVGLPAQVGGRQDCARCHSTADFRDVQMSGEEHGKWTGFVLRGKHAPLRCAQCHAPQAGEPRQFGRAPTRCDQCHQDPHAGQFRVQGSTDCAKCHDESSFAPSHFDHNTNSRFALDSQHARLACAACHVAVVAPSGERIVRYKPLGTRCQDCHAGTPSGKGR